jgi:hypothetical protein
MRCRQNCIVPIESETGDRISLPLRSVRDCNEITNRQIVLEIITVRLGKENFEDNAVPRISD